jgi:hypothetical protein
VHRCRAFLMRRTCGAVRMPIACGDRAVTLTCVHYDAMLCGAYGACCACAVRCHCRCVLCVRTLRSTSAYPACALAICRCVQYDTYVRAVRTRYVHCDALPVRAVRTCVRYVHYVQYPTVHVRTYVHDRTCGCAMQYAVRTCSMQCSTCTGGLGT